MPVVDLTPSDIQTMWELYAHYYGGTSETRFRRDLSAKTDVILSRDENGTVRGFSTIEVCDTLFHGRRITVLFSGDTIIDHHYWAKNDFALAWIRFAAAVKRRAPECPLYWLLIVKGHRTYRYLSVFGRCYYPAPGKVTPVEVQNLIDQLAGARFGDAYDRHRGLVRFRVSHGHLKPEWAEVPENASKRPEVAYFLERNPGYRDGDELVCLCEVSEENMKRLTLRIFREGLTHLDSTAST